jgi:hypothetical protein
MFEIGNCLEGWAERSREQASVGGSLHKSSKQRKSFGYLMNQIPDRRICDHPKFMCRMKSRENGRPLIQKML